MLACRRCCRARLSDKRAERLQSGGVADLEPIFEAGFLACIVWFRPGRGCHGAPWSISASAFGRERKQKMAAAISGNLGTSLAILCRLPHARICSIYQVCQGPL